MENQRETRGIALLINPFSKRKTNAMLEMRREARVHLQSPRGGYYAGEIESGYCLDRPDEPEYMHLEISECPLP